MKMLITSILTLVSFGALAHEIQGTMMLKGALKTKIYVNGVETVCRIKVDKVKNLLEEDSFGNPAYQVKIKLSLDGSDFARNISVRLDKEMTITNLHTENGTKKVKDFDYFSAAENVFVTIDSEGGLVSATFPYQQQKVVCKF